MAMERYTERILMCNGAMARGLVEAGVTLAASYPGTPASGICISPLF
jgi:TPP-dependent indolepyruvate ferredoxin oxidoreductase alpha subunit